MNIIQLALLTLGVLAFLGIVYMLVSGPNAAKASQRRLEQVRFRHSQSTDTKVESQLKKAIASLEQRAVDHAVDMARQMAKEKLEGKDQQKKLVDRYVEDLESIENLRA